MLQMQDRVTAVFKYGTTLTNLSINADCCRLKSICNSWHEVCKICWKTMQVNKTFHTIQILCLVILVQTDSIRVFSTLISWSKEKSCMRVDEH